jgi:hypothetical protein
MLLSKHINSLKSAFSSSAETGHLLMQTTWNHLVLPEVLVQCLMRNKEHRLTGVGSFKGEITHLYYFCQGGKSKWNSTG